MHLTRIHVEGFRNLSEVDVDLQPGLNVIVGPNNVGKSNLFDALRAALGPATSSDGTFVRVERDDYYRKTSDAAPAAPIRIDLTFGGLSRAQIAHFHELIEPNLDDITKTVATLHFEAEWDEQRSRSSFHRWGGSENRERGSLSAETLQALPITFLPALRDAKAALTPGYRNRLAHLFRDRVERANDPEHEKTEMVSIYKRANDDLLALQMVSEVKSALSKRVDSMAGADYTEPTIGAASPEFTRILRSLCVGLKEGPVDDVSGAGLGYSNLLYMGTVLTHLDAPVEDDLPLLVVEEPEAHLHPQLVQLLGRHLAEGSENVQTIVSTHSPALAASIDSRKIRPMYLDTEGQATVGSLSNIGLSETEADELERMMDMTRAALLFARAAILVEGVSEALLIPALARTLGIDLSARHVSVIPVAGVAFGVFQKLLGPNGLQVPVAIITDADPPLITEDGDGNKLRWTELQPETDETESPTLSKRTSKLLETFQAHHSVKVFNSKITLEYDLAAAAPANPPAMVKVWEEMFEGKPGTLNAELLREAGEAVEDQALVVWRGICLSSTSGSKAEFAHRLCRHLAGEGESAFAAPKYIVEALAFVDGAGR